MTVSSTVARNIDTCNGVTTVRTIPYKLLDATHVNVYRYTIATGAVSAPLTLNVDYTIQNVGADNAQYTMASADSSAFKLINIRNVPFSQAADYVQNDSFPAETHEAALDKLTMIAQQMQDTMKRAASLPLFADPALVVTLPIPIDGFGLVWSGTGGTIVNTSVSLATLQTQAALLAGIAADITTVAGISANVVSVDGNATNINTVAGLSAKITTLAAISTAITGVNAIATAVSTVSGISANVTTVAGISANVTTVAGISGNVTTVAGISANVTTVAGVAAGITTLSPIAANITTVAGISANVTTVAGISANVTAVAGDTTNINAVAAALTNINSVAADLTNINAVQADLTNIDTCAANLAAINAAPGYASAAAASAAAAAASASGISMRGSCRVASTTALTVTYANGVLGVGATLTNATTQAAFAMDGVTLAVGERVLIKDQASGLQNGMYTLTVAGSGVTNWVLTRATDYDEASEVVEGTATIIEEGTSNASHIYVMTHHGAITMGTTSIDFTSLSANATTANTLTTPRAIYGNNFDGSAALNQIIASTYGGTGNGFTKFSGPTTSEKTKTLRDATDTILELGGSYTPTGTWTSVTFVTPALGTPASGVLTNCTGYTDANLSTSDVTTNNSSTSKHGFLKKLDNTATHYMDGTGAWSTPAGAGGYRALSSTDTIVGTDNGKTLTINGTCALAVTASATLGSGFSCFIQNTATTGIQIITITPNGAENLDGANSTLIMLPGEVRELNCDGAALYTDVLVPFTINTSSTVSPTLPRNGYKGLYGQLWGGGASGGAGATNGGGGGGGGAYNSFTVMANAKYSLNSTALTLTIGAGGLSQTSANTAGNVGGTTSVQDTTNTRFFAFAYGGGAGGGSSLGAGGGGGGTGNNISGAPNANGTPNATGAGGNAVTTTQGNGGSGIISNSSANQAAGNNDGGGSGGLSTTKLGWWAYYGGGGGGCSVATTGGAGGQSLWGGGGGGGASNATAGAGGVSTHGGSGGAGAASGTATSGSAPGGGGGGVVGTGGSGAGAPGQIILRGIN